MKRGLFLAGISLWLVLTLWADTAQAWSGWDDLWLNADQQGWRLMQQGKAAEAAQTFRDDRRKAYARLQAGDYTNAAKDFARFDDSNGNYNRGNALAHAGRLQEAINAYDAALTRDPKDQDARHNRDLVAKALQQSQSKPDTPKSPSPESGGNGKSKQSGNSAQSDKSDKQGDKGQQGDKGKQGQNPQGQTQRDKPGKESGQGNGRWQPPDAPQAAVQQKIQTKERSGGAAQGDAAPGKASTGQTGASLQATLSEQQLAQEQWLRRIPDDPGGLLRRKFMIEHMIRQQGGQQ